MSGGGGTAVGRGRIVGKAAGRRRGRAEVRSTRSVWALTPVCCHCIWRKKKARYTFFPFLYLLWFVVAIEQSIWSKKLAIDRGSHLAFYDLLSNDRGSHYLTI